MDQKKELLIYPNGLLFFGDKQVGSITRYAFGWRVKVAYQLNRLEATAQKEEAAIVLAEYFLKQNKRND